MINRLNLSIDNGLPIRIQKKVLDHAAEERWKLFADNFEGAPVDFENLKCYVTVVVFSIVTET